MKITHYEDEGAAYLKVNPDARIVETRTAFDDNILVNIDIDAAGDAVGVEVIDFTVGRATDLS